MSGYSEDKVAVAWNGLNAVAVNGLWTVAAGRLPTGGVRWGGMSAGNGG